MTTGLEISWKDFEQSVTELFASKLGLVVDAQIFRGGIPQGINTGVGVVAGSLETVPYYGVRNPTFDVQILGRFHHRDDAFTLLSKLYSLNIERGTQYYGFCYKSITRTSSIEPYKADDSGRLCWCVSVHYRVQAVPVQTSTEEPAENTEIVNP